jgi:protein translocase SecG subunit
MKTFFLVLNIGLSLAIVFLILLQGRGAGLGSAWGGGGEFYQTRRGIERLTFILTLIFIFLFFIVSILNLIIK